MSRSELRRKAEQGKKYIAVDTFKKSMDEWAEERKHSWGMDYAIIFSALNRLSGADVRENVMGEWREPTTEGCFTHDAKAYSECSECGKKEFLGWRKNFCPNCGADMRGH